MTSENQTHIPVGWKSNKLGAICKVQKGVQFNKIELAEYGLYPCINGGIEPSGYSDLWNTNEDTITISEGGNSCGYVNFQRTKFWCGGHCYTLLNVQDGLDYEFLFWALKGKQDLIMDLRVGSGLPNIQQKAIKEFSFISPTSPTEQQKIASILSKLDEAITQTEQLIGKYKKIKEGLMHDLLTRGIDEQGNIRSEETHKFKDSPLGRIPEEWEVVKLGELINAIDPQPDHRTPAEVENGIPYLGISDFITHKIFDIQKSRKVSANVLIKQQNSFKVENGDLIFGKIGTIGRPTILPDFNEINFALSANVILIKPYECPSFIYWSMEANYVIEQVKIATHSTSQPAFGIQKIRDINILCPKPEERNIIASKLDKIEIVINETKQQLYKFQLQKSGLMHDLLTGKVRVKI